MLYSLAVFFGMSFCLLCWLAALIFFFCLLKNISAAKCVGTKSMTKKTSVWVVAMAVCWVCTAAEKS
jgi:hypothetical protein